METTINEVLEKNQFPQLTLKEVLESYDHIELTEEETLAAIINAKRKKEVEINKRQLLDREIENRKYLTSSQWSFDQTDSFMAYRAEKLFKGKFFVDKYNKILIDLLSYYFSNDERFIAFAKNADVENPTLEKGLLITGVYGVGKTWLMKLFAKNQRQVFFIRDAKKIAEDYLTSKDKVIPDEYLEPYKNASNDPEYFYHPISGMCVDDIGTEDVKNNFGNKINVIGDLIEVRYSRGYTGILLHGTTNLTADQLRNYYGGRVVSRMREIFNFIELKGDDRRK